MLAQLSDVPGTLGDVIEMGFVAIDEVVWGIDSSQLGPPPQTKVLPRRKQEEQQQQHSLPYAFKGTPETILVDDHFSDSENDEESNLSLQFTTTTPRKIAFHPTTPAALGNAKNNGKPRSLRDKLESATTTTTAATATPSIDRIFGYNTKKTITRKQPRKTKKVSHGLDFTVLDTPANSGGRRSLLIVKSIEPKSLFADSSLGVGDAIISINGVSFHDENGGGYGSFRPSTYRAKTLLWKESTITIEYLKFGGGDTDSTIGSSLSHLTRLTDEANDCNCAIPKEDIILVTSLPSAAAKEEEQPKVPRLKRLKARTERLRASGHKKIEASKKKLNFRKHKEKEFESRPSIDALDDLMVTPPRTTRQRKALLPGNEEKKEDDNDDSLRQHHKYCLARRQQESAISNASKSLDAHHGSPIRNPLHRFNVTGSLSPSNENSPSPHAQEQPLSPETFISQDHQRELIRINRKVFEKLHDRIDRLKASNVLLSREIMELKEKPDLTEELEKAKKRLLLAQSKEDHYKTELELLQSRLDISTIQADKRQRELLASQDKLVQNHKQALKHYTERIASLETKHQKLLDQIRESKADDLTKANSLPCTTNNNNNTNTNSAQYDRLKLKFVAQSSLLDDVMTSNERLTMENKEMQAELRYLREQQSSTGITTKKTDGEGVEIPYEDTTFYNPPTTERTDETTAANNRIVDLSPSDADSNSRDVSSSRDSSPSDEDGFERNSERHSFDDSIEDSQEGGIGIRRLPDELAQRHSAAANGDTLRLAFEHTFDEVNRQE